MRRSRVDTAATRQTIVAAASRLFVENGIETTGVGDVMGAVGLTVGGFYRHFESKDQLLAEATQGAFARLFERLEAAVVGLDPAAAVDAIAAGYLAQAQGAVTCPLANLGTELKRCNAEVRGIALDGHQRFVGLLATMLRALRVPDASAKSMASGMVSTLAGAVMLAQISEDPVSARAVLKNAKKAIDAQLATVLRDD